MGRCVRETVHPVHSLAVENSDSRRRGKRRACPSGGVAMLILVAASMVGCNSINWREASSGAGDRDGVSNPLGNWVDRIAGNDTSEAGEAVGGAETIRWDAGVVVLGEADAGCFSPGEFVGVMESLVQENRIQSARRLVRQYPDTALRVLQESESVADHAHALTVMATHFDELFGDGDSATSFESMVSFLQTAPGTDVLAARNRCWDALRSHRPDDVLKLKFSRTLPSQAGAMVEAEALRLEAIALMMKGKSSQSIDRLERAIGLIQRHHPYVTAHWLLLLGEFHRHADELEPWKSNWARAVEIQSRLLVQARVEDPSFWNRAAYLRPAGEEWPQSTLDNFKQYIASWQTMPESAVVVANGETLVWLALGLQHLARDEGQNAVLAFKKSEAVATSQQIVPELQLLQARALTSAGQPGAASAILIRLASAGGAGHLEDRAKAVLGSLKLQNGAILQGSNLIEDARRTADQWPPLDRLKAQADFALALLIRGREKDGITLMEQTETEFASLEQWDQVLQCRENLVTYFESKKSPERLQSARARLQELY